MRCKGVAGRAAAGGAVQVAALKQTRLRSSLTVCSAIQTYQAERVPHLAGAGSRAASRRAARSARGTAAMAAAALLSRAVYWWAHRRLVACLRVL